MSIAESSFRAVVDNLVKEIDKIERGSVTGLLNGIVLIRRSMDRNPPLIPVDTGNLRQSWFVTTFTGETTGKFFAIMGFSANYALLVHEDVGVRFRRPNAGAKFFEASIKRNERAVLELIAKGGRSGK